jgi:hypothetical protein
VEPSGLLRVALEVVAVTLVVVGSGLTAGSPTWAPARRGLTMQLVGIALLLADLAGVVRGFSALAVAGGVYALLLGATDEPSELPPNPRPSAETAEPEIAVAPTGRRLRRPRPRRQPIRAFDLSVLGLAIVGGLSLAASRPLLQVLPADAIVDVLILGGLASCLLGHPVQVATGVLSVVAAVCLLVQLVDPQRAPLELVLLAAAQLGLALAVSARQAPPVLAGPPAGWRWRQAWRASARSASAGEEPD